MQMKKAQTPTTRSKKQNSKLMDELNSKVDLISLQAFEAENQNQHIPYVTDLMCSTARSHRNSKDPSANFDRERMIQTNNGNFFNQPVEDWEAKSRILSKTVGAFFQHKALQSDFSINKECLFLTQGGEHRQYVSNPMVKRFMKSREPKKKFKSKPTFSEFINELYLAKTEDLKTLPNTKQQKLFEERCHSKFCVYSDEKVSQELELKNQSENKSIVKMNLKENRKQILLERISVGNCDFGVNSMHCIGNYIIRTQIQPNTHTSLIKEIILDKNPLGDEGVDILSQVIQQELSLLVKLSLVSVNMSSKGATLLLKSLVGHPSLQFINLSSIEGINRNRLGKAVSQMQKVLSHPSFGWKQANLSNLNLPHEGLNHFTKGLQKNNRLQTLNLSQNEICFPEFESFVRKLQYSQYLTVLNLSHNKIGDHGLSTLSQVIGSRYGQNALSRQLKELNLSFNSLTSRGLQIFAKNMLNNQALTILSLRGNDLSQGGRFYAFKHYIHKNWALKTLDLTECFSSHEDPRHLFEGLEENRALETLRISKNFLTLETFSDMATMLTINKSLKEIEVEHCNIGDKYISKFEKQLKSIKSLERISLGNNFLTDKSGKLLLEIFVKNKTITDANLSKNCLNAQFLRQIQDTLQGNKKRNEHAIESVQKNLQYLEYVTEVQECTEKTVKNRIDELIEEESRIKKKLQLFESMKKQQELAEKQKQIEEQKRMVQALQKRVKSKQAS